jgi:hypothetical protein
MRSTLALVATATLVVVAITALTLMIVMYLPIR